MLVWVMKQLLSALFYEASFLGKYGNDSYASFSVFRNHKKNAYLVYGYKIKEDMYVDHILTICSPDLFNSFFKPLFDALEELNSKDNS